MHKPSLLPRLFAITLWVLPVTHVSASTLDELLAKGDSLYEIYDYDGSSVYYGDACRLDSNSFESFWKLGRSLNLLGETAPKDSQLAIYEAAMEAESRAIELDGEDADAHFQLSRALGKIALFKGIFKSASLARKVKREAERALEIDSLHDGAWHILGRWHREVGKKPKILRIPMRLGAANKKDALAFMERAVKLNPGNVHHRLEMGITYDRYKKKDLARAELKKCLELESGGPLDNKYKEEAKKYLAEMDQK